MTRSTRTKLLLLALLVVPVGWYFWAWATYPSDRTPEGAYLRVMSAVNRGRAEEFFAYTETEAQHACYTIRNYRRKALERVRAAYPEADKARLVKAYRAEAEAPDGADVFALYSERHGWLDQLRRDMSGIHAIEVNGERATLETVKGTRYPFRRRDNGIWGLTLFTPLLVSEAEKAARDFAMIEEAAKDYERVRRLEAKGARAKRAAD